MSEKKPERAMIWPMTKGLVMGPTGGSPVVVGDAPLLAGTGVDMQSPFKERWMCRRAWGERSGAI
jgi:hypothetical protein